MLNREIKEKDAKPPEERITPPKFITYLTQRNITLYLLRKRQNSNNPQEMTI